MSMFVTTTKDVQMSPEALAKALWKSEPEEFAQFWFAFEQCYQDNPQKNYERLCGFAKAMAPRMGEMRKNPLRALARLLDYYEVLETRVQDGKCLDVEPDEPESE